MKGFLRVHKKYLKLFSIILLLAFLSACGGVTPGTNPPVISFFTASSTSINEGESVTLSWETTGATNVYLSHDSLSSAGSDPVDLSGFTTVSPDEDTIYTLTATNDAGSDTDSITITVSPAAIVEQTITIQPGPSEGKDSYVYSGWPDSNMGYVDWVRIGQCIDGGIYRAYLQFNLNTLPAGAVITNAVLKLYQFGYQSTGIPHVLEIGVYRVNGLWGENDITWNTRPGYKSTPESKYHITPYAETWLSRDITSLVQGWFNGSIPNYGVVLRDTDETTGLSLFDCYSSDYTDNSSLCPKLEITYYAP